MTEARWNLAKACKAFKYGEFRVSLVTSAATRELHGLNAFSEINPSRFDSRAEHVEDKKFFYPLKAA